MPYHKNYDLGTRHAGSQSNKCDGIDAVLQVDEAAKMASNITNDGSAATDEGDRYDKSEISIAKSWKKWMAISS
jgi:hypothetical protein